MPPLIVSANFSFATVPLAAQDFRLLSATANVIISDNLDGFYLIDTSLNSILRLNPDLSVRWTKQLTSTGLGGAVSFQLQHACATYSGDLLLSGLVKDTAISALQNLSNPAVWEINGTSGSVLSCYALASGDGQSQTQIAVDSANNIYLSTSAYAGLPSSSRVLTTIKYNAAKEVQWQYTIGSDVYSFTPNNLLHKDGKLYVGMQIVRNGVGGSLLVLNSSTGALVWSCSLANPATYQSASSFFDFTVDASGYVYAVGERDGGSGDSAGSKGPFMMKITPSGTAEWIHHSTKTYKAITQIGGNLIALATDFTTSCLTLSGVEQWSKACKYGSATAVVMEVFPHSGKVAAFTQASREPVIISEFSLAGLTSGVFGLITVSDRTAPQSNFLTPWLLLGGIHGGTVLANSYAPTQQQSLTTYYVDSAPDAVMRVNPEAPPYVPFYSWAGNDSSANVDISGPALYQISSTPPPDISWMAWSGNNSVSDIALANSAAYGSASEAPAPINWSGWTGNNSVSDSSIASSALQSV